MASLKNIVSRGLIYLVYKKKFLHIGTKVTIRKPLEIKNAECIRIGDETFVGEYSWLLPVKNSEYRPTIDIGKKCQIGHFSHIVGYKSVVIEDNVLIADKVFISDCSHSYQDVNEPIIFQPVSLIKEVNIGDGSWIGENVCICGASVGKHCVIGSNSVVTHDIPDYSVAVGAPAHVIKQYDIKSGQWKRVVN